MGLLRGLPTGERKGAGEGVGGKAEREEDVSKTKTITRLRKHRGNTSCAYCGHVTPALHGGVPDKMEAARHILTCDKRPERSLCRRIERLEAALKYCATTLEIASSGVPEVDKCIAKIAEVLGADWRTE